MLLRVQPKQRGLLVTGVLLMKKLEPYHNEFFSSDVISTWTEQDWKTFCSPCLKHPAEHCQLFKRTAHPRYRPPFNNRFRDERYPTPYGSMGARVPGEHRNEQRSSAVEAGRGGPNGPTPSRLIYTNCDRTPDTSLISWGLK